MRIAIVGASGAVGREILSVIERRNFPFQSLRLFASTRSKGTTLAFRSEILPVEELCEQSLHDCDLVFLAAGKRVSADYAPIAKALGSIVIDSSSLYRQDSEVPLVIPEINAHALKNHKGIIASPNCTTSIMLMALAPLHRICPIKRIVAATYQAASGGGATLMNALLEETRRQLLGQEGNDALDHPYAFNLFLHNSPQLASGYNEEEVKMVNETRKILEDPQIALTATCVRVPTLRAHSIALNVEFQGPLSVESAYEALEKAPGLLRLEEPDKGRFPMPSDASKQDAVLYGRIRKDLSQENTLELWVVGDQLLKGAALNAVQIAESIAHV